MRIAYVDRGNTSVSCALICLDIASIPPAKWLRRLLSGGANCLSPPSSGTRAWEPNTNSVVEESRMHVSYVVVLISAVIQWLLGALWYGLLFKKSWQKLVAIPEGEKPKNAIFAMAAALV